MWYVHKMRQSSEVADRPKFCASCNKLASRPSRNLPSRKVFKTMALLLVSYENKGFVYIYICIYIYMYTYIMGMYPFNNGITDWKTHGFASYICQAHLLANSSLSNNPQACASWSEKNRSARNPHVVSMFGRLNGDVSIQPCNDMYIYIYTQFCTHVYTYTYVSWIYYNI